MLRRAFAPIFHAGAMSSGESAPYRVAAQPQSFAKQLETFCAAVEVYYQQYSWKGSPCGQGVSWKAEWRTPNGHPLLWAEFGSGAETTLLMSGVHPDELTPVPFAFRFAEHLRAHPEILERKNVRVIVMPLVNPDGFLRQVATRTNSHGVDLNRNFFTRDWYERAKDLWSSRGRLAAHFPGYFPNSEIETLFQIELIEKFRPDKILSIHAPLGFLDYDGPGDRKRQMTETERRAKQLVHAISEESENYRVVDYTFFPGSLGNFAGNERHIPTITLELETTDPTKVEEYWKQFLPGLLQTIHYPFRTTDIGAARAEKAPNPSE